MAKKVTTRKYNGDDQYSWAVFVDGVVVRDLTGLSRGTASYYKRQILESEATTTKAQ